MDLKRFFAFLDDKGSIGPKLEKVARIMFYIMFGFFVIMSIVVFLAGIRLLSWSFLYTLMYMIFAIVIIVVGYFICYLGYIGAMAMARLVTN